MDEDTLQRRIYFLTFIDLLDMIFSQYRETCEVLLDYPKIGRDYIIENYAKKAIRDLLRANSDVHSRRLIAEFPKDGIKCIEKLQSYCAIGNRQTQENAKIRNIGKRIRSNYAHI